jgi:hypothetical protein
MSGEEVKEENNSKPTTSLQPRPPRRPKHLLSQSHLYDHRHEQHQHSDEKGVGNRGSSGAFTRTCSHSRISSGREEKAKRADREGERAYPEEPQ